MDCSPPGSSVLGISQARILEQVAISFSRGSSLPVLHSQHHLGSPAKTWCSQINFFKSIKKENVVNDSGLLKMCALK